MSYFYGKFRSSLIDKNVINKQRNLTRVFKNIKKTPSENVENILNYYVDRGDELCPEKNAFLERDDERNLYLFIIGQ